MQISNFSKLFFILLVVGSYNVVALHTGFCIRLPGMPDSTYQDTGEGNVKSVGIEKFPQDIWEKYHWNLEKEQFQNNVRQKKILRHKGARIQIRLFNVQGRLHGKAEPLNGVLKVNVAINVKRGFSRLLKSFVLYATDEQHNVVGQFFNFPIGKQGGCEPSDATNYMIIPCGGVGPNEALPPNMVLYARNNTELDGNKFPEKYKASWPIVPDFRKRTTLNFYYRYSIQDSNRNFWQARAGHYDARYIFFRIFGDPDANFKYETVSTVDTKDFSTALLSDATYILLHPGAVPGASDPLLTDLDELDCQEKIVSNSLESNNVDRTNNKPNWEKARNERHIHWYMSKVEDDMGRTLVGSQRLEAPAYLDRCISNIITSYTGCLSSKYFGGRCSTTMCEISHLTVDKRKRPIPSSTLIPLVHSDTHAKCQAGTYASFPQILPGFVTAIKHDKPKFFNDADFTFQSIESTIPSESQCEKKIEDVKEISVSTIRKVKKVAVVNVTVTNQTSVVTIPHSTEEPVVEERKVNKLVVDTRGVRTLGFGTILYSVRKGHGVVMIILSIFCVPISIFCSRYYKETFMATRILYSRPWFQIHLQLTFWMAGLYFAGIVIAIVGKGLIGVSLTDAGLAHRIIGWMSTVLFLLIACTGSIRCYEDPGRTYSIVAHWVLGYLIYILNFLAIYTSVYIPGSPSADDDKSLVESSDALFNKIFLAIVIWLIYEMVIQVVMTILIYLYDREMKVTNIHHRHRKYIPPFIGAPIPVLRENIAVDAAGSGARLLVFWMYIGVATLMTFGAIGAIMLNSPLPNLGFGPMSCTHEWNETAERYVMRQAIDPSCRG